MAHSMGFFGFHERLRIHDSQPSDRRIAGRLFCERLGCNYGRILDLSGTGARIQRPRFASRIRLGSVVQLQLVGEHACLRTEAQVVWIAPTGFGRESIGVRFAELSSEDKRALNLIAREHTTPGMAA
ncbi:MAG: PilZ domain-containing protein [Planctomycetota bacterium]